MTDDSLLLCLGLPVTLISPHFSVCMRIVGNKNDLLLWKNLPKATSLTNCFMICGVTVYKKSSVHKPAHSLCSIFPCALQLLCAERRLTLALQSSSLLDLRRFTHHQPPVTATQLALSSH